MIKRVAGTLFAALAIGSMAAAPAQAVQVKADFTGIVALSNCSGSVVRPPQAKDTDPALVMSNGHCVKFMGAYEVIRNQASSRTFTLLSGPNGTSLGTLRATKIAYATMKDTDVSFYQLTQTYAQIQQRFGSRALELSTTHPVQGASIQVVSGYWKTIYSCNVDGFAFQLKEDAWTWRDSVRYTPACKTIGGTSGSPVIDTSSGKVVAINNTGNEDGQRCTLNNPCEVSQTGQITVRQGINYAQEIYNIPACIGAGNQFSLTLPGCTLPR
jgi:V8-like Glu-specific endopeptidase